MKKADKELRIFELRLKELESKDKYISSLYFKLLAGFASVFAFLFVNNVLLIKNWNGMFFGVIVFVIFLSWSQRQLEKYLEDCYTELSNAVKTDTLVDFNFPSEKWWHSFYYKRKFELRN